MDDRSAVRLDPREIHDFWPRVLASPIVGALVANLSGLIDHGRHSTAGLIGSYAWFATVAFLVWEGNRRLYFRMQRREDWLRRPWQRLGLLVAVISLYTIPMAALLLWMWRAATADAGTRPYALPTALLAIVALSISIGHVYETVFLLRDWESDRLRAAHMEQARLQTELESLGREVDPHFLFNNLNALTHLIEQRSEKAAWFIGTLSATYRYVLECRGRTLVPLTDELDALERHHALAYVRYAGAVRLAVDVQPDDVSAFCLPPVTLPEVFQNAIKHNVVDAAHPLHIRVRIEDQALVVSNDLRPAGPPERSTGFGLINLRDRFRIATGRHVVWGPEGDQFVVRLPLAASATAGDRECEADIAQRSDGIAQRSEA